ncbi:MAG TPA: hypothetical protein VL993_00390 [Stellaceae bacterium]|nr:hypothetical protein [Stellaceae bacterium]
MSEMRRKEDGLRTGRFQVSLGTQLILCSVLVIFAQIMLWLWQGQWPPFTIAEILRWAGTRAPMIGGPDFDTIVTWILAAPISAAIAAIGFVLAWTGAAKLAAANN